jgi:hypothetical protein
VIAAFAGVALWRGRSVPPEPPPATPEPAAPAASGPPEARSPAAPAAAAPAKPKPRFAPSPAELASLDEARLMARLREAATGDPALAVTLAREGNRRFPSSADAPERTSILIHALAGLDRSGEARGEAEKMVNDYPDSEWVREIERFTGAHRHRNMRVNDAGVIEYYDSPR